jgi:hypothetical protein
MKKIGSVNTDKTVKAGCGIRYDPDVLGEETGFDFTEASTLLDQAQESIPTSADTDSDSLNRTVPNQGDSRN